MCGIAGQLNFRTGRPVEQGRIRAMCDLLAHRGPDGEGHYVAGPVGLGHRRLAIIDLSDAGRQPMTAAGGQLVITFNGEIYNFRELRRDLETRGHVFSTRTDTEVILAAYREFGVSCVERLNGMFAFAIWDAAKQELFAARDRLGKKPFHYWVHEDGVTFASEPKAFLADERFVPSANPEAIWHYLAYQYVPSPLSAFEGVKKLPAAHYLTVRDGRISTHRYWRLRYEPKRRIGEREARDELESRLRAAVRRRLISDVPLGAFLSGGVDSSAVVAIMAQEGGTPVKTFSIGFDESDYDELPYARMLAARYGTEHREFVVRPRASDIFDELVWHYNEPFADESAIPTYYLSALTRQSVTVALNGDGGDECFAGYRRYEPDAKMDGYGRLPGRLRQGLARAALTVAPRRSRHDAADRIRNWIVRGADTREGRYLRRVMHFEPELRTGIVTPEFLDRVAGTDDGIPLESYRRSHAREFVDVCMDGDVQHYLPDCLLVKVDVATMAHGLEGRSPLLDYELMEFAAALPLDLKVRGNVRKWLLKESMRPHLPPELLSRPKKGCSVPLGRWLRRDLLPRAREVLLDSAAAQRGLLSTSAVRRMLEEHAAGAVNWHHQLWNLLMLELWCRMFLDRRPEAPVRKPLFEQVA
jgi:asparagine synthase (glutamine-hydrolysing)